MLQNRGRIRYRVFQRRSSAEVEASFDQIELRNDEPIASCGMCVQVPNYQHELSERFLNSCKMDDHPDLKPRSSFNQGCKIRSGRDRIIRIFESSEFGKVSVRIQEILLDFIRNSEMSRTFNISLKILRNSDKFSSESVQKSMKGAEKSRFLQNRGKNFASARKKKCEEVSRFFLKISGSIDTKDWKSCRSRKTLQNEYLVARFCFDTAENEPSKV